MRLIAFLFAGLLMAGQALAAPDAIVAPASTTDSADARLNAQAKRFNEDVAARNQARQADYDAQLAQYQIRKQSDQDAYAENLRRYSAEVQAQDQQHAADLAAWRKNVAACRKGDLSKCDKKPAK
ncbi:MAG TPA: hypothetical protein VIJ59_10155 [Caulobacteraceae bacterium]